MRTAALAGVKEFEDDLALLMIDLKAARHVIGLVDEALEGVRLVGGDQNPLGWRDVLGAAASKIRKVKA